jgi:FdhE protein
MAVSQQEHLLLLEHRLAALRKSHPELHDALVLQEELIRTSLTSARPAQAGSFPLPREHVAARIRQGIPLLHEQPLVVDVHFAADLFSRLVNVLQHHDHLAELAVQSRVDAELLISLAIQSVAPVLRAYAELLMPLVERLDDGSTDGAAWQQGYCPVCGGWPALGELRGVELARYLRCGACGSGWRSRRLFCPYCENEDFRALEMLTIEEEQRFKISVCERCHCYLKVANAFDPLPAELLALDDVATLHLDVVAIERGYRRPGGSGFVIELAVPEDAWVEELA